ncbi:LPXTG cell wall anchor domain-containing protein [Kribbella deserti]|uniref:LPXTG cell wall anchor domain-containing protein n=1 Tax=Kribbella deserti TaxID=1926257 RepID=A0ABV6QZ67_9ACTN
MSQLQTAAPPAAAPPVQSPYPGQGQGQPQGTGWQPTAVQATRANPVKTWFEGTPGRLRAWLLVLGALGVVFGLCAAQGFRAADGSLNRAEANTAQLVRIQAIHTSLVSANADATNAFLSGGLEPPAQRQHFTDSMAAASKLITEAAKSQPADAVALGALNTTVLTYQGLVEQARANNRQALPVGAQYLKDANALLQTDALPVLTALVSANEKRLETELGNTGRGTAWVVAAGLVTLLVLGLALFWLARRTHRYLNLPLFAAALVVLLTTIAGGAVLTGSKNAADDVRDTTYAGTIGLARARVAAFDAKSNESLTLIARGSGAAFEKAWVTASNTARQESSEAGTKVREASGLSARWDAYVKAHEQIRQLDDSGRWDAAVQLALNSPQAFNEFDKASSTSLAATSNTARADLLDAGNSLPVWAWLGLPIGLLVALLAWWGLSQRLEEYR